MRYCFERFSAHSDTFAINIASDSNRCQPSLSPIYLYTRIHRRTHTCAPHSTHVCVPNFWRLHIWLCVFFLISFVSRFKTYCFTLICAIHRAHFQFGLCYLTHTFGSSALRVLVCSAIVSVISIRVLFQSFIASMRFSFKFIIAKSTSICERSDNALRLAYWTYSVYIASISKSCVCYINSKRKRAEKREKKSLIHIFIDTDWFCDCASKNFSRAIEKGNKFTHKRTRKENKFLSLYGVSVFECGRNSWCVPQTELSTWKQWINAFQSDSTRESNQLAPFVERSKWLGYYDFVINLDLLKAKQKREKWRHQLPTLLRNYHFHQKCIKH